MEKDPINLAIDLFTKIMQRGYDHYHDEKHVQEAIKALRALQSQPATDGLGKVRDDLKTVLMAAHEEFDGAELNMSNYRHDDVRAVNDCYVGLFGLIEEALTILDQQAAHNPWQPIETAPRDGTSVILTDCGLLDTYILADFDSETGRWLAPEGFSYHPTAFTHWMPLPAAPDLNGEE